MFYEFFTTPDKKGYLYHVKHRHYAEIPETQRAQIQLLHYRGFTLLVLLAMLSLVPNLPEWLGLALVVVAYLGTTYQYYRKIIPALQWQPLIKDTPEYNIIGVRFRAERLRFGAGLFLVFGLLMTYSMTQKQQGAALIELVLSGLVIFEAFRQFALYQVITKHPIVISDKVVPTRTLVPHRKKKSKKKK